MVLLSDARLASIQKTKTNFRWVHKTKKHHANKIFSQRSKNELLCVKVTDRFRY
jgi:hypothetical protein